MRLVTHCNPREIVTSSANWTAYKLISNCSCKDKHLKEMGNCLRHLSFFSIHSFRSHAKFSRWKHPEQNRRKSTLHGKPKDHHSVMFRTPVKVSQSQCIICSSPSFLHNISNSSSEKSCIAKYLDISVVDGHLCRYCTAKLSTIDKKITELKEKCRESSLTQKRCASAGDRQIEKKQRGQYHPIICSGTLIPIRSPLKQFVPLPVQKKVPRSILPKPGSLIPLASPKKTDASTTDKSASQPAKKRLNLSDHSYSIAQEKKGPAKKTSATKSEHDPFASELIDFCQVGKYNALPLSKSEQDVLHEAISSGNVSTICTAVHDISTLSRAITDNTTVTVSEQSEWFGKQSGETSYLFNKAYKDLKTFSWREVIKELKEKVPTLLKLLLNIMLPAKFLSSQAKILQILPRIGMIWSIAVQSRFKYLSKAQRVLTLSLCDTTVDQKVYDRLQPLGVTLSYSSSLDLLKVVGDHYKDEIVAAVQLNKRFRLAGDNINWTVGVSEQRLDHKPKMYHAFGSMAVIQETCFDDKCDTAPKQNFWEVDLKQYLVNEGEWKEVREEYVMLIARTAQRHIPAFEKMKIPIKKGIHSEEMKKKNQVIPLPVLFKNEQRYDDVVDIMNYYEEFVESVYANAEGEKPKVHVGGDQLTRERFSGAKCLCIGETTPENRFEHLSPITFELFHLLMNYLMVIFKQLYKEGSERDLGTMKCEQLRIGRSNVDSDVRKAYTSDKDFFLCFVNAYIVEAVLDFFNMENVSSALPDLGDHDMDNWAWDKFGAIVDKYVGPKMLDTIQSWHNSEGIVQEDGQIVFVDINGARAELLLPVPEEDRVKNYGHLVLELGLLYLNLLDMIKYPDRDRGLRLLKLSMVVFKSNNNLSKYAYEIVRLLVHQLTQLSDKAAHEEFYGLFVNTKGHSDSHVPVDERMEWLVGSVKKHVKHMYSNQTEHNVTTKSSALAGLHEVSENYDACTNVLVRSKKHSARSALEDERAILRDLRKVEPFKLKPGRHHTKFPDVPDSIMSTIPAEKLLKWIHIKNHHFATEHGN